AIEQLLKIGVDVETILNGGAEAVTNLAAATSIDLVTASDLVGISFNVWGEETRTLSGDLLDAAARADIFTAAANASAADVSDLSAGLRILGPQMAGFGVGMEEPLTAIAYFTQGGLSGSDA